MPRAIRFSIRWQRACRQNEARQNETHWFTCWDGYDFFRGLRACANRNYNRDRYANGNSRVGFNAVAYCDAIAYFNSGAKCYIVADEYADWNERTNWNKHADFAANIHANCNNNTQANNRRTSRRYLSRQTALERGNSAL